MQKKRFLILTNRVPYPLTDGGNLAMNAMIDGYHSAGKEVYLLAMNTTRHPVSSAQLADLYKHTNGFSTVDIDNNVHFIGTLKNFLFSRQPNHADRFYHTAFIKKLEEVINAFKPDVIQIESVFLSTYLPFIKKHSSAILVLRMHNIEYQVWQRLACGEKSLLKKYYLNNLAVRIKHFEEYAWQQYDLLLPISYADSELIKFSATSTPYNVATYGIDAENIHQPTRNEKWEAYHLGAMDWRPNAEAVDWFLQNVWPLIHEALPDFRFSFAGRYMPDYFKNLNIEGANCLGEVQDANTFIADKKILIVPLRSGGGIRVKILEAMAAGKIVISTDIGMQGVEALPGTHYLAANEPEDFHKAIKWCLENKDKAEMIASNAVTLIKTDYEQRAIMKRVIEKIDSIKP